MNYYEHHIRDYDTDTAHLTWEQDLAYTRLIRLYYRKELPIPADIKEACRLVRAVTKSQRDAVAAVLKEFFELREDGWHKETCDEAIERYQAGEPEREVKKANEDNRLKKHREERSKLFKIITDAGQHLPWNAPIAEVRALAATILGNGTATPRPETVTPPATAPATPATATQSPITNHQSPDKDLGSGAAAQPKLGGDDDRLPPRPPLDRVDPSMRAVEIATLLTGAGVKRVTAFHPDVAVTWAQDERVTDELLLAAVAKARETLGNEPFQHGYLRPIVVDLLNPPAPKAKPKPRDDWAWRKTPAGIEAKARELRMVARGGESHESFAVRIQAEIDKRNGRKP